MSGENGGSKPAVEKEKECCGNCYFWTKEFSPLENPYGLCVEGGPQCCAIPRKVPVVDKQSVLVVGPKAPVQMQTVYDVNGFFPPTGPGVWCGKYWPKSKPRPQR